MRFAPKEMKKIGRFFQFRCTKCFALLAQFDHVLRGSMGRMVRGGRPTRSVRITMYDIPFAEKSH